MILFSEVKQKYPDSYLLHGITPIDVNGKTLIEKLIFILENKSSAYLIRENHPFENVFNQGFVIEEAEIFDVKREDGGRNETNNYGCTGMSDKDICKSIIKIYRGTFFPNCDLWIKVRKISSLYYHPTLGANFSDYQKIKAEIGIDKVYSIDFLTGKITSVIK